VFLVGDDIADFIETEDRDAGIILDQGIEVLGSGQSGGQFEKRKE